MIGLFEQFTPKFVKRFTNAGQVIEKAIQEYCSEVRGGTFPAKEHFYEMPPDELKKIR